MKLMSILLVISTGTGWAAEESRSKDVSALENSAEDWEKTIRKWKQGLAELGIDSGAWPEFDKENKKGSRIDQAAVTLAGKPRRRR